MKYQFVFLRDDAAYDARSKAPKDVESVLSSLGYRAQKISLYLNEPAYRRFPKMLWRLLTAVASLESRSTLVLQYPLTSYFYWVLPLLKLKGIKLIAIVHDLESYRWGGEMSHTELDRLRCFDRIVVHTDKMKEVLILSGLTDVPMVELQLFDYLAGKQDLGKRAEALGQENCPVICFAGNLTKSLFLPDLESLLSQGLSFRLYGAEPPQNITFSERLVYAGSFQPDDLEILQGNWGLVWDGDSIETCSGSIGNYLRINAPHKASLYLAKGIPLIVWSESGIAPFVREHHLGIAVRSLRDVAEVICHLDEAELALIRSSAKAFGERLRRGDRLAEALSLC